MMRFEITFGLEGLLRHAKIEFYLNRINTFKYFLTLFQHRFYYTCKAIIDKSDKIMKR